MSEKEKPYTIKFSHKYLKMDEFNMKEPFNLLLVAVLPNLVSKGISDVFRNYDTSYWKDDRTYKIEYYELPQGPLIMLLLEQDNKLMTTLRRFTERKMAFYQGLQGKEVMVGVVEQK